MRKRLTTILAVTAAVLVASSAWAQARKDTVRFTNKSAMSGTVLRDTWQGVEVDRSGNGEADKTYAADVVERVDYGNPLYVLQAKLKLKDPKELIKWYTVTHNVYTDTNLSRGVRQQAYYDVANAWATLARRGRRGALEKTDAAFARLFREIPDTRYAVRGRKELGSLYLEMGKSREAVRQFEVLASGRYGAKVSQLSKLLVARVELTLGRWDRAERLLGGLSKDPAFAKGDAAHEVKLLRTRALVGQKKYTEAYSQIETVLADKPSRGILGLSYCVLGDYFLARGDARTALSAYLRTVLMYDVDTDSGERARCRTQAAALLRKLGRPDLAGKLASRR